MLRDFLIRLVAFTILCALGLAWVKYHFLDGTWVLPETSEAARSPKLRRATPKSEGSGTLSFSF